MLEIRFIFSLFILFFSLSFFAGCSSSDKKADTAEGAYAIAQDFDKGERYEEAIRRYQEVKNKFPYSKYAIMSELAMADVYFKQESYAEAQIAYQTFRDLHPKHSQVAYVVFRLGLSYFNQLPETVDRDLSLANNAILVFNEVIKNHPNSEFFNESKEKRDKALQMLAGKEEYIADFYFIRKKYDSALSRYEGLIKKYPNLGFDAKALSRAAICASKTGEQDKARKHIFELEHRFPNSSELEFTKKELH